MDHDNPFQWLGEQLGHLPRLIVDGLAWLLTHLGQAFNSFYRGLGDSLGINPTPISLIILLTGLALLFSGLRSLLSGRLFRTAIAGTRAS